MKNTYTDEYSCKEIQKLILKKSNKKISLRTVQNWFKDVPRDNEEHKKIPRYYIDSVSQILAQHGIYQILEERLKSQNKQNSAPNFQMESSNTNFKVKEQSTGATNNFYKVKIDLLLRFILEKCGYKFNDEKLKKDLTNQQIYNSQYSDLFSKPNNDPELIKSVKRIEKYDYKYYLEQR